MTTVLLDTGVLGRACHASHRELTEAVQDWIVSLRYAGHKVVVPEIADYELRRGLLRVKQLAAIATLDRLGADLTYLPLNTGMMFEAASLWAETRRSGRTTAPDAALDGDVILAAQTISLEKLGHRCIVATTNVRHLNWFVDARTWDSIDPAALT